MSDTANEERRAPKTLVLTPEIVDELNATRRFWQRQNARPLITYALLLAIFACGLLSMVLAPDEETIALALLGAKLNFYIDQGQFWRFVTPLFLHGGLLHLSLNAYALYLMGRMLENVLGRMAYLSIFALSGVVSIYASYLGNESLSVGASGAIFGLLGAGVVFGLKHRADIPRAFQRYYGAGLLPWVALNLILGFTLPNIDNYAHIGGLVAGVLLARLLDPNPKTQPKAWRRGLSWLLASASFLLLLFALGKIAHQALEPEPLPLPAVWHLEHLPKLGLTASIPSYMQPENRLPSLDPTRRWVEPHTGFFVGFSRTTTLVKNLDELRKELERPGSFDEYGAKLEALHPARLAGKEALKAELFAKKSKDAPSLALELWLIPAASGLLVMECGAPQLLLPVYEPACRAIAKRLVFQDKP